MTASKAAVRNSVTAATFIVLLLNLLSRVLGFVREMVMARVFGASAFTDAYLVAYTLPYSAQQIVGWAIVSVTVPLLTKYIVEDKRTEANLVVNHFLNGTALLTLVISLLGVVFAPLLVKLTAPSLDGATAQLAVKLTRIIFPSMFFVCIGMVLTGILNANHRFAVGTFAPAFSNIIIIATVLLAGSQWGVTGLAVGTLVSFIGFFLIQLPSTLKTGFSYRPHLVFKDHEIQVALASLVPIILGMSVNQIYYILNRIFASGLAEGSISALNYAAKLSQFPAGIFITAIAVVVYPLLTEFAIKGDLTRFNDALEKGLGTVMLLMAPATAGLIVMRVPIVRLLFEGGAFTATDTVHTASALLYYAIGIVPCALILVLLRVFLAFRDVKTPVYAGAAGILANVILSFVTIRAMGHNGLALATTAANIVNTLVFFIYIKKHLPRLSFMPLLVSAAKILAASVLMGAAVYLLTLFAANAPDLVVVVLGILCGVLVYTALIFLFRMKEGVWLKEMLMKKMIAKRNKE